MFSEEALQRLQAGGLAEVQIAEVDVEKVGNESTAFRVGVVAESKTEETFGVLFRREGMLAVATVGGYEGSATVKDAVTVAEQLDARIQDVLNR